MGKIRRDKKILKLATRLIKSTFSTETEQFFLNLCCFQVSLDRLFAFLSSYENCTNIELKTITKHSHRRLEVVEALTERVN